jgi:RNA polymerase sigma-70 factor (ECF subfamily)
VATVVLGTTDGADDVVQLAIERAWRALRRFDVERPFRPWLLRIVANAARNDRRARGRRAALSARAAALSAATAAGRATATPDELVVDAEERRMVLEALAGLGAADRLVIALRHFEDLTEEEMAGVLGVRPGTVKSRLSRAMTRLRRNYLALLGLLLLVVLAATLATAPARQAVADWLGVGSTHIERTRDRVQPSGSPPFGANVRPASPDAIAARLGGPPPDVAHSSLGRPDRAGLVEPGQVVLYGWRRGGATLAVQPVAGGPSVTKFLNLDDRVVVVPGLGDEAVGVDAAHVMETEGRRFAANRVVLWRRGDRVYRLESNLRWDEMVRIAREIDAAVQ